MLETAHKELEKVSTIRSKRTPNEEDSERIDRDERVFLGTIKSIIDGRLQDSIGSAVKRALRPSADQAELAVLSGPLQATSITDFPPRIRALFRAEHESVISSYIDQAQGVQRIFKALLSQSTCVDDLVSWNLELLKQFEVAEETRIHMHTHIHTHVHTYASRLSLRCLMTHRDMHTYIHTYIHTHVRII